MMHSIQLERVDERFATPDDVPLGRSIGRLCWVPVEARTVMDYNKNEKKKTG